MAAAPDSPPAQNPDHNLPQAGSRWDYIVERWNEPGFTATPEELAGYEKDRVAKQAWQAKRVFYRITGIPMSWENSDLVEALQGTFGALPEVYSLTLQAAADHSDGTQTAILKVHPDYSLGLDEWPGRNIPNSKNFNLYISKDFSGLTPLNTPQPGALADVIAVHDLNGHAYGSWVSRQLGKMWIQDLLAVGIENVRFMTYGYDISTIKTQNPIRGQAEALADAVINAREVNSRRSLIFFGHGLGGIIIVQMLKYLSIRSVKAHRETIEATKALLLFGTPHQGQNATPEVYKIDEPVSGSSLFQVLRDLAKGSDYMRTYRETVTNLSAAYPQIQFFTMYETDCAPTYMKDSETGEWNPDGGEAMVVPKESAMLWWPLEQHMAIPAHHHDMIKYETDATPTLFFLVVMDKIETEETERTGSPVLRRLDAGPAGLLDLSLRDKSGSTPLHEAATCNSLALIDLLLTHGAEVDATDGTGETPLHKAARNGYVEAVERLLSSGASLAATNSEGQTPLHRAARGGHVQVAWLLILHGRPGGGPGAIPPPNFTMDGCCGGRR